MKPDLVRRTQRLARLRLMEAVRRRREEQETPQQRSSAPSTIAIPEQRIDPDT